MFTEDIATILEDGTCNYCLLHDQLESNAKPTDLPKILHKVRRKGLGKQYDCLIGISGGADSSVLLYAAVREWGLRPLVIHFDNGYNAPEAEHNMSELVKKLGVNWIRYGVDKAEYDALNKAFLWAGTPDADIPNDIAMTKLMYDTADKYGIKYILNGHDFRTEGSTPAKWTYMDAKYIRDVYDQYQRRNAYGFEGLRFILFNYPLFTFKDQIIYALKGIKQVRPFHYGFNRLAVEFQMKQEIAWQDYGGKHCENVYTEFVGAYLLPRKFNIDKRIVYLSAQVRSGTIDKVTAKMRLMNKPNFDWEKMKRHGIAPEITTTVRDRSEFDSYNWKRYKFLLWTMYKVKVIPFTFYKKATAK